MKVYSSSNNEINWLFKLQNIEDILMYINVVAIVAGAHILTHPLC